ncbi:IclR family transcriptional regulator [soil metagenome]
MLNESVTRTRSMDPIDPVNPVDPVDPVETGEVLDHGGQWSPVKSADRALGILEALARHSPLSLGELSTQLGIPKSSLHGIVRTMEQRGWVEADSGRSSYRLGLRCLVVGAGYVDGDLTVGRTAPLLDELAAATSETVHLGRLEGREVVYMAKRESVHPLRMFSAVGRRLPAHATALGKAMLACRSDDAVASSFPPTLDPITPNTIRSRAELIARLAEVRETGIAVDNEEATVGLRCFAVALPFREPSVDAISVSIPVARLDATVEAHVVGMLRLAVAQLARARPADER